MEFKAIPTMYKGVQMRSRLEARWAAVFDALGASWEYEPFDLNGWIPDFLVFGLPIPLQGRIGLESRRQQVEPLAPRMRCALHERNRPHHAMRVQLWR